MYLLSQSLVTANYEMTEGLRRVYWPENQVIRTLPAKLYGEYEPHDSFTVFIVREIDCNDEKSADSSLNSIGTLLDKHSSPVTCGDKLQFRLDGKLPVPATSLHNYQIMLYKNVGILELALNSRTPSRLVHDSSRIIFHLSGIAFGVNILLHYHFISGVITYAVLQCKEIIINHMYWFQTAQPAGVKLHKPTCLALGSLGHTYIDWLGRVAAVLEPFLVPLVQLIAVCFILGGLKRGLQVTMNVVFLMSTPILLPNVCLAYIFHAHLCSIRSAWHATTFHRKRDSEQAISVVDSWKPVAGLLLLLPLVLFLPTTTWWYMYTVAWAAVVACMEGVLVIIERLAQHKPLRFLLLRIIWPFKFIEGVEYSVKEGLPDVNTATYCQLEPKVTPIDDVARGCLNMTIDIKLLFKHMLGLINGKTVFGLMWSQLKTVNLD